MVQSDGDWVATQDDGEVHGGIWPLDPATDYRFVVDIFGPMLERAPELVGEEMHDGRPVMHYRLERPDFESGKETVDLWVEPSGLLARVVHATRYDDIDGTGETLEIMWTWEVFDVGAPISIALPPDNG